MNARGEMGLLERAFMRLVLQFNDPHAAWSVGARYIELMRSQWQERSQLERLQADKLGRLLRRVRATVPHFAGYAPWDDTGTGDLRTRLARLPILTKAQIRRNPAAMLRTGPMPTRCRRSTTGGTTGTPVEVWAGREVRAMITAAYWRGKSWAGIRPWTRGVIVGSFDRGSWYGRIRYRLTNKKSFDVFGKNRQQKQAVAAQIKRFAPRYLENFVSSILELGEACAAAGVRVERILTTGEMLYEHQRQELERLYGARVSDYYGCNEVCSLAYECTAGRKHVTDEHVILEVVDEAGRPVWDRPGRILLTDLDNELSPFIRYEVGDVGVLTREPCPCGRQLTVLQAIEGRTQDALVNEAGDRLSTVFISGRFKGMKALNCIQLVQRSPREVELLYEGPPGAGEAEIREIIAEIQRRLGTGLAVIPRRVAQVTYTQRGKRRLIIGLNAAAVGMSPQEAAP